jgi:hypothetical protein
MRSHSHIISRLDRSGALMNTAIFIPFAGFITTSSTPAPVPIGQIIIQKLSGRSIPGHVEDSDWRSDELGKH